MKTNIKVTTRDIAKMLVSQLPVEGAEYGAAVETALAEINKLPTNTRNYLKLAYIFSRKAPREEREDLFQEITLALLQSGVKDVKLAYSVARCDWKNFWARYKTRQHFSLDSVISDEDGNECTIGDLLVGEIEYEHKLDSLLDAELLWNKIPADIKPLVTKKLIGKPLTAERKGAGRPKTDSALSGAERVRFHRWLNRDGYKLLLA